MGRILSKAHLLLYLSVISLAVSLGSVRGQSAYISIVIVTIAAVYTIAMLEYTC